MTSKLSKRSARGWVIGAVVGIAAGSGVAVAAQDWQESRAADDIERRADEFNRRDVVPAPVDAVRELVQQDSLVAVDPLLADRLPAADRQRAEEILAGSPVPARIAYLSYPDGSDSGYTPSGAAGMWQAAVGEQGHYVVLWDSGYYESTALGLEDHYVSTRTEGQPGPALVRLAEEMATWEAEPLAVKTSDLDQEDYWGGVGGGIMASTIFAAIGVLPLFFLLRWYVGSRRRKQS